MYVTIMKAPTSEIRTFPGAYLTFGSLLPMIDYLPSLDAGERVWFLFQLAVPWFLHDNGSPAAIRMETEEEWMWRGVDKKGGMGGEEGRETVAGR